jgi:hypothetical protein
MDTKNQDNESEAALDTYRVFSQLREGVVALGEFEEGLPTEENSADTWE